MNLNGLFVIGTDTGVGKTLVAGALCAALRARGLRVAPMKPVETGCELAEPPLAPSPLRNVGGERPRQLPVRTPPEALCPADALFLRTMAASTAPLESINPYRYAAPVAPAVAAQIAGRPIELDTLFDHMRRLHAQADLLVVEGAGGLLVPLTNDALLVDLVARSGLPALVVARSALGTINHSLLTLNELTRRQIPIAGLILNRQLPRAAPDEAANPEQIERFAGPILRGVLPFFDEQQRADPDHLARRLAVHVDLDAILRAALPGPA